MPNIVSQQYQPTESPQEWAERAREGALGTNAKSSSPSEGSNAQNHKEYQSFRAERYALQNVIRRQYIGLSEFDSSQPDWDVYNGLPRVVKCKRTRVSPTVGIYLDTVDSRAHYTGIHACGSVWTCPICCAQIQKTRREEIGSAIDWAYQEGYKAVLVTFTVPHYRFQACSDLLNRIRSAFKYLRSGKRYQGFKNLIGYQGNIRALEVRYGNNGWHPHTHELFFVDRDQDAEYIHKFLTDRWEAACRKFGLIPRGKVRSFRKHAVDVKDAVSCSEYLAKQDDISNTRWGADQELTAWISKTRGESAHPFQLAAAAGSGDSAAWELFEEYAEAFKGLASVFWSRGLKAKVNVNQVSDEEIADQDNDDEENQEEKYQEIAHLDVHSWNQVLQENARAHILDLAENAGAPAVNQWLRKRGLDAVPPWFKGGNFTPDDLRLIVLDQHRDKSID